MTMRGHPCLCEMGLAVTMQDHVSTLSMLWRAPMPAIHGPTHGSGGWWWAQGCGPASSSESRAAAGRLLARGHRRPSAATSLFPHTASVPSSTGSGCAGCRLQQRANESIGLRPRTPRRPFTNPIVSDPTAGDQLNSATACRSPGSAAGHHESFLPSLEAGGSPAATTPRPGTSSRPSATGPTA